MFYTVEKSGVKYLKSDILEHDNLIHAFSSRIGGNTPVPLNSFSLGTAGMMELKNHIENNRKKICDVLEIDYSKIINPEQKHTDNIKIVKTQYDNVSNTDGIITSEKGLVILLLFADCVPIILYAPKEKVLGVIHAGWRGTAKKIAGKAISLFESEFNVSPNSVKVAIGAAIGQCCYPVSAEIYLELKNTIISNYDNIFRNIEDSDKVKVDLKMLNSQQLQESGVQEIDILKDCTSCNNSLFYSYRADNGQTGRHGAIVSLR
ncbi:MAG: peptidoglycan editing factor PgeF [Candidatus Gastranaerophilales bacterium]|nr:peptidoglycan editing factor PgeF [Candidatus Gastranaerophilales bacterium]